MRATFAFALLVLAASAAEAQQGKRKSYPGVDSRRVDAAIERGTQYLLGRLRPTVGPRTGYEHGLRDDEFILYTLLRSGAGSQSAGFQEVLKHVLGSDLERTYTAAVQAMVLSELDPAAHQERIAACCQFLVDNQTSDGSWSYGEPTNLSGSFSRMPKKPGAASRAVRDPDAPARPPPEQAILVPRQRFGTGLSLGGRGDNSNSQYAALGLRACMEADVLPTRDVLDLARRYWENTLRDDGAWNYSVAGSSTCTGSMTAGAVGSLIVYRHALKLDWKRDPAVQKGLRWVGDRFTPSQNPGGQNNTYYWLYAVERLGIFSGAAQFGAHDWYREGANYLLAQQKPDGSWQDPAPNAVASGRKAVVDTCFALLFLRRATPPLVPVATPSAGKK